MNALLYRVAAVIIAVCGSLSARAQTSDSNIPAAVSSAFTAKYPSATLKKWRIKHGMYTAKATVNKKTYVVNFDAAGNWISSASKLNWPWHLPAEVKAGFKRSKYHNWNMYTVMKVEKPSGEYYRFIVDDRNHRVDIEHQNLFTERRAVEVKTTGELTIDGSEIKSASL